MQFGNQAPAADGQSGDKPAAPADHPVQTHTDDNTMTTGGDADPDSLQRRLDADHTDPLDKTKDKVQTFDSSVARDPSAAEAGVDVEKAQDSDQVGKVLGEVAAANAGVTNSESNDVIYSCHPVQNMHIGPYHFENSVLRLKGDQEGKFKELLDQLPPADRLVIKKLDMGKVDEIVASRSGAATKNFDSATGKEALANLQKQFPAVGTQAVEDMNQPGSGHASLPQDNGNKEVPLDRAPDTE